MVNESFVGASSFYSTPETVAYDDAVKAIIIEVRIVA